MKDNDSERGKQKENDKEGSRKKENKAGNNKLTKSNGNI